MGGGQSHEISPSVREEHADGALVTGLPQGRYRDAEHGGEWVVEIDELPVERGRGFQARELGAGEERPDFPNGHFDVVKAGLGEDVLFRLLGDGLRVLQGHLQGLTVNASPAPLRYSSKRVRMWSQMGAMV